MNDLARFLTSDKDAGHVHGMRPEFASALSRMFAEAPPEIQAGLKIYSGYRSPERQAQLWEGALRKYGSPQAARRWVAPPGRSQHNHGNAADLRFLSPDALRWAHQNASRYGLAFPLSNENWHIELASARGGQGTPPSAPVAVAAGGARAAPPAPVTASAAPMRGTLPTPEATPAAPAGAAAPSSLAAALTPAATPAQALGSLALAFMQQSQAAAEERRAEAEADALRRQALFSDLGAMFG